jgi:hypothetical protein
MLAASGCFSLPKPPPFERAVAAKQLEVVSAPEAAIAAPAFVVLAQPAVVEVPVPERTDVRGAGDGSMKVASREADKANRVVVNAKGIPHRAPNFSSEQAASMICAAQKSGFNGGNAKRMHEATLDAERAKKAWDEGRGTRKDWEKAELTRQDAVIGYMFPIPVLNMFISPAETKGGMPKPESGNLVIENTDLFTFRENGKEIIAVTGYVRNRGTAALEVPPLTMRAIDQWDYAIAGQTSLVPFTTLAPAEEQRFELRFLNPPAYTAEVYVHFAPPFVYRNPRDCDFFDPAKFDEAGSLKAVAEERQRQRFFEDPIPIAASTASGPYTAGELNELALYFRRESEAAFRCQNLAQDTCASGPAAQRMHWRDMFVLSEAVDQAWIATSAAEETRRAAAAGDAAAQADAARDRSITRFRQLAQAALVRSGTSAQGIEVAVTNSTYGRDAEGLYVEIAGTVRNASADARHVDNLMIAFVDRLELPLSSIGVAADLALAPGETKAFTQRLVAGAGGRRRNYAPARVPPRDIPWEVRVGAMSQEPAAHEADARVR